MRRGRNWDREETLMALALYFTIPTNQADDENPEVIELASRTGRTPAAVALKISNLMSCDPMYPGKAMRHRSRLDEQIWAEYEQRGDELVAEAVALLLGGHPTKEGISRAAEEELPATLEYDGIEIPEGRERETILTLQANQTYFRKLIMKNYEGRCCLTGLSTASLLVASRIKPWASIDPVRERLTPENGLLLNALHDKAFSQGLMTIDKSLRVVVSPKVKRSDAANRFLWTYHSQRIEVPGRFLPRADFIEYHNDVIFQR